MLTAEPKAYGSNWYAATRVDGSARPGLTIELDVEVCVIGAGLAGLTVAREVARLGRSVVVLEAKSVAWSASGRNTGVVLPGFAVSADALIERVGLDAAKALWARSEAGAEYVRTAARDMPGVGLNEGGWLHVSKTDDIRPLAHEAALLAGEFGAAVEPWPVDRVREALHSPRYFHGLHYPRGFSLHPLNYAHGLAAAAEASGARIFEDTPVLEIDPDGVRKRVITSHSRVRAAHIVLAGNVHLAELVPQFSRTLLPIFSTVVTTAPLGDQLLDSIRYPGAVSDDTDLAGHHHRIIEGRRLMWCGRSSVRLGKPHREGEALVRRIRRTYPALRNVKVEHAWIGVAGHTVHGMPQLGEITPGLWLLSGFGGHGINTAAMGGEMLARAIVDNDRSWQMFSPFALVWAGGAFGRAAQPLVGWSHRTREAVEGVLARRRDAKRRRAEAAKAAPAAAAPPATTFAAPAIEPVAEPIAAMEPAPVAPAAALPATTFAEPAIEPVAEPIMAAMEPALAAIEAPAPGPSEHQSAGAGAPIPNEQVAPVPPKRPKRGPKKKKSAPPQPLKDLFESASGTEAAAGPPDGSGVVRPPLPDEKI